MQVVNERTFCHLRVSETAAGKGESAIMGAAIGAVVGIYSMLFFSTTI